jgi:hypothetical protein
MHLLKYIVGFILSKIIYFHNSFLIQKRMCKNNFLMNNSLNVSNIISKYQMTGNWYKNLSKVH